MSNRVDDVNQRGKVVASLALLSPPPLLPSVGNGAKSLEFFVKLCREVTQFMYNGRRLRSISSRPRVLSSVESEFPPRKASPGMPNRADAVNRVERVCVMQRGKHHRFIGCSTNEDLPPSLTNHDMG
ncbi:uncharacterized protein LOC118645539 [Monomorium pharaonis]|uniref:uncharacterized protein LOC118645539 n=1 Tax=Monomorium pharaonis TaxID=307658 RepID=UPI001747B221|nr:uncharacterized protein LOC118645539 [Monomorium pharaonis]